MKILFINIHIPFFDPFPAATAAPGFLLQLEDDDRVLQTVLQLFLQQGPKRLPRPSEVLFCDDKVPLAEVQASPSRAALSGPFLGRCCVW